MLILQYKLFSHAFPSNQMQKLTFCYFMRNKVAILTFLIIVNL